MASGDVATYMGLMYFVLTYSACRWCVCICGCTHALAMDVEVKGQLLGISPCFLLCLSQVLYFCLPLPCILHILPFLPPMVGALGSLMPILHLAFYVCSRNPNSGCHVYMPRAFTL